MTHLFTAQSNARLTFILGTLLGVSLVTIGGLFFFMYLLSGGTIGTYEVQPLDDNRQLLEEPDRKSVV